MLVDDSFNLAASPSCEKKKRQIRQQMGGGQLGTVRETPQSKALCTHPCQSIISLFCKRIFPKKRVSTSEFDDTSRSGWVDTAYGTLSLSVNAAKVSIAHLHERDSENVRNRAGDINIS